MSSTQEPHDPTRVGPYHLVRKIGEGGMGEVWLARQEEPLRRTVAVKIVRLGLETKPVLARFESERQAIAMMDHPNIARAHDAGETESGRPYFVMEYVDGRPITEFCDEERLDTRARLGLLVQVCEGLQHAHQKAIIHRDIKPSNVLVSVEAGRPVPKLIDFGVAKATEQSLTERTLMTELGQIIGTPEYMSPEQAELTGEGIDIRTDIYSLGVLMYELLVGVLPFEKKDLLTAGFEEMLRRIREDDPPRPSTRVTTIGDSAGAARTRSTTANRLASQLRGDLDWITMKALERDRTRRYRSAAEFADDIQRYLADEPVSAGPPGATYRVKKFVRRHRIGVSFASVLLLFLISFALTTSVQAGRIEKERDRAAREADTARRVSEFLVELFRTADPDRAKGADVTAREILDEGARQISELDDEPETQAAFMETIGRVYNILGLFDEARPLLTSALEIREQREGQNVEADSALAKSLYELALFLNNSGKNDDALPLAERAVSIHERLGEAGSLAESLNVLGNVHWQRGELGEAEKIHRRALEIREATFGADSEECAVSLHNLAALRYFDADLEEAESMWQRARAIEEATVGKEDFGYATTVHVLSIVAHDRGNFSVALERQIEALAIREKLLGPDHPHVALSLTVLGNIHRGLGKPELSIEPIVRAIEIAETKWGPVHPELWWMKQSHARALNALERFDEAEPLLIELVKTIEEADKEAYVGDNLRVLGNTYLGQGRTEEAESTLTRAVETIERLDGPDNLQLGFARCALANAQRERGADEEAERNYVEGMRIIEAIRGPGDVDRVQALRDYVVLLERLGRTDEALSRRAEADRLESKR